MPVTIKCQRCGALTTPTESRLRRCDRRCNSCINADSKAYRERRKAEGRPVKSSRLVNVETRRAYQQQRYHSDDAERQKQIARAIARKSISRGRLHRQPCEVCGCLPVDAHHDDYSQPLAVRWLCPTHHRQHHAALRAAA